MSQVNEKRLYRITGDLPPEKWQAMEEMLGHLGASFTLDPVSDIESYRQIQPITKGTFRCMAVAGGYSDGMIHRTWNLMAYVYAWEQISGREVPPPFRGILQYATVINDMLEWGDRVSDLMPDSFIQFVQTIDEQIAEAGSVNQAQLPTGFGPETIRLVRDVKQKII